MLTRCRQTEPAAPPNATRSRFCMGSGIAETGGREKPQRGAALARRQSRSRLDRKAERSRGEKAAL